MPQRLRRWLPRMKASFMIKCIIFLLFCGGLFLLITIHLTLEVTKTDADRLDSSRRPRVDSAEVFLVVLLLSSPKNIDQRAAIRQTWLIDIPTDSKALFVVGTEGLSAEEVKLLKAEERQHRDLLLLPHVHDSYAELTDKLVESLTWLNMNLEFSFVFKGDDDTFARLDLLHQTLQRLPAERLYWGFFDGRARVKRAGQWAEPNWIMCDRYLPHARGGGYVLSADLVRYIAANSVLLQRFKSEDISVGAWLGPLKIQRIHDPRFDTEYVSRGCRNDYVVTHKQDAEMMRTKFKRVRDSGKLCENEFQTRLSYVYNWAVLPSNCCLRNDSTVV